MITLGLLGLTWDDVAPIIVAILGGGLIAGYLDARHDRAMRSSERLLTAAKPFLAAVEGALESLREMAKVHAALVSDWGDFWDQHDGDDDVEVGDFLNDENAGRSERMRQYTAGVEASVAEATLPLLEIELLLSASAKGAKKGQNCLDEITRVKDVLRQATPLLVFPSVSWSDARNLRPGEWDKLWVDEYVRLERPDEAAELIRDIDRLRREFLDEIRSEVRT